MRADSVQDVLSYMEGSGATIIYILSDIRWDWRDDKVELMLSLKEQGYSRLFADGEVQTIDEILQKGSYPKGAMLLIDRLRLDKPEDISEDSDLRTGSLQSVGDAFDKGTAICLWCATERKSFLQTFRVGWHDFRKPDEYLLSFNSPWGHAKYAEAWAR